MYNNGSFPTENLSLPTYQNSQIKQEVIERLVSIADLIAQVSHEISNEIESISQDLLSRDD